MGSRRAVPPPKLTRFLLSSSEKIKPQLCFAQILVYPCVSINSR
jgi:hypothetical protein